MRQLMCLYGLLVIGCLVIGCHCPGPTPPQPGPADSGAGSGGGASVSIANRTQAPTTVYVSFGADSSVQSLPGCTPVPSGCSMPLAPSATQPLSFTGYLNITLAFGAPPSCGQTEAEVTVNTKSGGQDTTDVSLVGGYSDKIEIDVSAPDGGIVKLGPPAGPTGNETVFGVFPAGCDICVARQKPPCPGQSPCGSSPNDGGQGCGCKTGGQYNPTIPCQYGGPRGQSYTVALVP